MSLADRDEVASGVRVGDREREQAVAELREQYVLGRLDHEEFQQRLDAAVAARTDAELRRLVADLPAASRAVDWRPGRADARPRPDGRPYDRSAGEPDRWRPHGRRPARPHWHHHHRGPGLVPLLPIAGIVLVVGGWSLLFLMPLLIGGLVFSAARHARHAQLR